MSEPSFENLWYEYLFQAQRLFEGSLHLSNAEILAAYNGTLTPEPKADALDQLGYLFVSARRARHSIVFSALGAEAYINAFAAEHLGDQESEALDQLRPAAKWQMIPKLAFNETIFSPGDEPLQSISQLFRRRNRLVHAKRGEWIDDPSFRPAHYDSYNPDEAVKLLIKTLEGIYELETRSGRPPQDEIEYVSISHLTTLAPVARIISQFALPTEEELKLARARLQDDDDVDASGSQESLNDEMGDSEPTD